MPEQVSPTRGASRALHGLRVLDRSSSIAGQFAGRLFADNGAEVVLAEPPEGSVTRRTGERWIRDGVADHDSLLFAHLNGGKVSITVEPDETGVDLLAKLMEWADLVLVDEAVDAAEETGPIIVAVVPFSAGPYATWKGTELIHQALSGSMYITGTPDREPLYGTGHRASYSAGVYAYIGALALLHSGRGRTPSNRHLSVSVHEAAASFEQNVSTQWGYSHTVTPRGGGLRPKGLAPCADGWVAYFIVPEDWEVFCRAFGRDDLLADPRFSTRAALSANWAEARIEIAGVLAPLRLADIPRVAIEKKVVIAPVSPLGTLFTDQHLTERDFWVELPEGASAPVALGPLFRLERSPALRNRPAPRSGSPASSARDRRKRHASRRGGALPLSGLRVLEFTNAWAGPMTGRILALLGADVIKVEGPRRLDSWRFETTDPSFPDHYPDSVPGEQPWNASCWFNSQNHDKRSLVIDLKDPAGLAAVRALAERSDILFTNWSAGVLDRLGLGRAGVAEVNPELIFMQMPAAGLSGPLKDMRGYGPTMEAMSGMTSLIGYPDGRPTGSGSAYLDPIGALHGAAAALTALIQRDAEGLGQRIEVAQQEAAMHWIGEAILAAIANGVDGSPTGNLVPGALFSGAFPTRGADRWIAIEVHDEAEADVLVTALGLPRGALDSAAVASATIEFDARRLSELLQGVGIAAAPVLDGQGLFEDEHLRAGQWFATLDHPVVGERDYPGLPFIIDGVRVQPRRPSPVYGADNEQILRTELGWTRREMDQLVERGAMTDRPA